MVEGRGDGIRPTSEVLPPFARLNGEKEGWSWRWGDAADARFLFVPSLLLGLSASDVGKSF